MRILPVINFNPQKRNIRNHKDYAPVSVPIKRNYTPSFEGVIKTLRDFKKLGNTRQFHCIYCGRPIFASQLANRLKNNGTFSGGILDFAKEMFKYLDYLHSTEKSFLKEITVMAFDEPQISLSQAVKKLYPNANRELLKEQLPIIKEISMLAKEMPYGFKEKFRRLIQITKYKLEEKEYIPDEFSGKEFAYKINRIKDTIKDDGIANRIIKLTEPLTDIIFKEETEPLTDKFISKVLILTSTKANTKTTSLSKKDLQLLLISQIRKYAEILKRNDIIRYCDNAVNTIERRPVKVKFSNKAFRYDINEALDGMENEELRKKIFDLASNLPTSKTSINAFITKHENAASDTIGYDVIRPSRLTIEHLHTRSDNGSNDLPNVAYACERDNNERSDGNMAVFIKKYPLENQFNYFKELWEEAQKGNISKQTVLEMIDTFFFECGRIIDKTKL